MPIRVHGGEARGRRLQSPKGIRPSQGLVKEAIFNVLAGRIEGARVLDLYAGSGALGIEALSRGAAWTTFVERDARHAAILRRNLEALDFSRRARVVTADVRRFAAGPEATGFDIVLADPPYGDASLSEALASLAPGLKRDALVVVEHSAGGPPLTVGGLPKRRSRRYGDTGVTLLQAAAG